MRLREEVLYIDNFDHSIRIMHFTQRVLVLGFVAILSLGLGCKSTDRHLKEQFMVPPLTSGDEIKHLELQYTNLSILTKTVALAPNKTVVREQLVSDLLRLSDYRYNEFKTLVYANYNLINSAVDLTSIGLSAAATLTGGTAGKIMSGADTALKAAQGKVLDRWFQNQAILILIDGMEAQRAEKRRQILEGLTLSYEEFPIERALLLIEEYHQAASFPSALSFVRTTLGAKKAAEEK